MIQDHISEDRHLITLIAEGDEAAFRQLYDQYRKRIYSYAFNLTESKDKAAEVVQEVFIKVWVNRSKLSEISNFNGWLHTIARNIFYDTIRKVATQSQAIKKLKIVSEDSTNDTDYFILDRENDKLLQQALDKLPDQQKLVFQLRSQGFKRDEIAQKLQISENTVKVHLTRALATIKAYLSTHTDTALFVIIILLSKK